MSFLHSAFIENSKVAREWLESIGYKLVDERIDFEGLQTNPIGFKHPNGTYRTCYFKPILVKKSKYVDCRGNLLLFKAITALRDDSSLMQWFTDGYHWERCPDESADVEAWRARYTPLGEKDSIPHKATLEELIEHFKTETI